MKFTAFVHMLCIMLLLCLQDQYVFIHKTLVETMDRLDRYSNLHA